METIVLGGGCFWCVEGALLGLQGVNKVTPGYSGGHIQNPSYEEVCGKGSGHAEVVEVSYDENIIPRRILLEVFFTCHDPTQLNRQGNDIGHHYRSVIFYKNEEEKTDIDEVIGYLQQNFIDDIVTEVSPLINFFIAEDYHQNYFANNPNNPYCAMVVNPKISKTRSKHASLYK